ncbi:hypothetical protein ACFFMR_19805 [Micromonospora andamanensis]|uniref:TIR domain-containing protein n=1 Tax=Micromonospora andamanensis TaxID=1287068 RepID=A0ABQ4HW91_9ACTN|nr:hypothetical protein [Micromonospora andamanensis]GIJ09917.1 hypothetical protein Van01_31310 [Micromonospora andamanensis]
MTPDETQSPTGQPPCYFFLSHAHPPTVDRTAELDYYERAVFEDLARVVGELPRERPHWRTGMFRPCGDPSTRSAAGIERALATVAVFVALRSESYDTDEVAAAERSVFLRQPATLHSRLPGQRLLPVLWEVTPGAAGRAAVTPIPDVPQYAETGLIALSRRRGERDAYERVLAYLGDSIVELAEGRGGPPGTHWPPPRPREARPAFVVATLAAPAVPDPVDSVQAAASSEHPDRLRAVAAQVAGGVNRARFDVQLVELSAGYDQLGRRPAVLLVEERAWVDAETGADLRHLLDGLPAWVQPLIVPAGDEPVRAPEEGGRGIRQARPVARPRIMAAADDPLTVIAAAIGRAVRHFDDEHLVERRYPPRPRSNSHPEE